MSKKTKTSIPYKSTKQDNSCADDGNQSQEVKKKHPGGRPSIYSQELADEICLRLSEGETLRSICNDPRMPSTVTIFHWEEKYPEFLNLSARAREKGTHQLADECIAIADDPMLDPNDKRIRIDTRLRLIGKWNAKKYGDKVEHQVNQTTQINYSFSIPDRETIQLESGAIPTQSLPDIIHGAESTESDEEK